MSRLIWVFIGRTSFNWFCHVAAHMIIEPSHEKGDLKTVICVLSNACAQPLNGARYVALCLKPPLNSYIMWANSEGSHGSGKTARMCRLTWAFVVRLSYGWVRVLRPFNSISVISRQWKGEHERLCAMKRCLGSGRISLPAGFEPATPLSEVRSTNRSATRTLLFA